MGYFTTFVRDRFWHIAFAVAVVYFLVLLRSDIVQRDNVRQELAKVTKDTENEQARRIEFKTKLRSLSSGTYIEKLAREKLGFVIQGETPYKVIIK